MDTPEGFVPQDQHDAAMLALRTELSDALNLKQAEINDLKRLLEEAANGSTERLATLQAESLAWANKYQALEDTSRETLANVRVSHQAALAAKDLQRDADLANQHAEHQKQTQSLIDQANTACNALKQELQSVQESLVRTRALYEASRQVIAAHEAAAPESLKTAMIEYQRTLDEQAIAQLQARLAASAPVV